MARIKGSNVGESGRFEFRNFNDLRYTIGVVGIAAKEERATERWIENVREEWLKADEINLWSDYR